MPTLPGHFRRWSEAQALTRAAPTLATEGLELRDLDGFRVMIAADSGQTLSGAGTLKAYYYDYEDERWKRDFDLDLTISASVAGLRDQAFPDTVTTVGKGRALYAASGVTVSGGTVTVVAEGRVLAK